MCRTVAEFAGDGLSLCGQQQSLSCTAPSAREGSQAPSQHRQALQLLCEERTRPAGSVLQITGAVPPGGCSDEGPGRGRDALHTSQPSSELAAYCWCEGSPEGNYCCLVKRIKTTFSSDLEPFLCWLCRLSESGWTRNQVVFWFSFCKSTILKGPTSKAEKTCLFNRYCC